jgi:hypothetical protein
MVNDRKNGMVSPLPLVGDDVRSRSPFNITTFDQYRPTETTSRRATPLRNRRDGRFTSGFCQELLTDPVVHDIFNGTSGLVKSNRQPSFSNGREPRGFKVDRERISQIGCAAPSALEIHRFFQEHPVAFIREAHKTLPISIPTLRASAKHLVQLGILRELPSRGKAHVYAYDRYLEILNAEEGE